MKNTFVWTIPTRIREAQSWLQRFDSRNKKLIFSVKAASFSAYNDNTNLASTTTYAYSNDVNKKYGEK